MRILMVCLGNICRSPLAEGMLRHKIVERGLPWEVDSAGTAKDHAGSPPDSRMIQTAQKAGIDLTSLRARQFTSADFQRFDRIYVMDHSNRDNVLSLAKQDSDRHKVALLLNHLYPNESAEVPDPYYGNTEDFQQVLALVDAATEALINDLSHEH